MTAFDSDTFFSPAVSPLSKGCPRRLIDSGMLHYEASLAGCRERYQHGETPHTIHVWWARRPHSAMRPLVFASLTKDTSDHAAQIMASLASGCNVSVLSEAHAMIRDGYPETPKLLDMFGGGGTIPMEAKRLGVQTYTIDANQLSVFIQICSMCYADQVDPVHARKLAERSGKSILRRVRHDTAWLYPLRQESCETVFGYLWSYELTCRACGKRFYLIRKPLLSSKKGRNIRLAKSLTENGEHLHLESGGTGTAFSSVWVKGSGKCICPHCHAVHDKISMTDCTDALHTVVRTEAKGKSFALAPSGAMPPIDEIRRTEEALLKELRISLPASELPVWTGIVNPSLHGFRTHADFLNPRQRLVLLYLIRELLTEFETLRRDDPIMAKFVIGTLSGLIDQVVDWNCRLSMWIPVNEQVGRAFCGPGVAMLWDYAETDMLLHGPANLWDKLRRILKGMAALPKADTPVYVAHAHAQALPFPDAMFDAIVTDPPYYDNIYYSVLADFFYAWKRPLLRRLEPELFAAEQTDTQYELAASSHRFGKGEPAHEAYCRQLGAALCEAARVLKPDGVFSFIYAHSSVKGWDAVIRAFRASPFCITSVQPLSIERKGRPRSVTSEAVNTCITFVARRSTLSRTPLSLSALLTRLEEVSATFGTALRRSGWNGADTGLAILAFAVGMIANAERITGAPSDTDALVQAGKAIKAVFPEFTLKNRRTL